MPIMIMYHYTLQLAIYYFFLPQSHFALLKLLIKSNVVSLPSCLLHTANLHIPSELYNS